MQIKSLIFYNSKGEKRILKFGIGKVNIITGESKTGKTAIIDIVNYCLGSDACKISEGVIKETVEWFSILLQHENEEIFIARQNPNRLNQITTFNIYLSNSDKVKIPDINEIRNNSDIISLKDFLTKKLFIAEYTNTPISGNVDASTVNFKHSRFYSYQPQDLIAQRNYLFYNQQDTWVERSIRETLPYFLGAIREDTVRIEQEVANKKRELNKFDKELKEYERIKEDGSEKIFELVNEAKQLNLISSNTLADNTMQAISAIREVLNWEESMNEVVQGEDENLKKLLDEKNDLERELSQKKDTIDAVDKFINHTLTYSSEVEQQKARLESVKFYDNTTVDHQKCPLCCQNIENEIPSITAINKSLINISQNLEKTILEKPKLNQYSKKLDSEQSFLKKQIEIRRKGIIAIYAEKEQSSKQKDLNLRRGKIIGKILLFLESYQKIEEDKSLSVKIEALKAQIDQLENSISSEEKDNKLNSILNQINNQMTTWSKKLDLEYPDAPIRFDIKKLTIFADTPKKSIPLTNMGSGANWVAYHLLIHFALHKHFIEADRPVPRFLILDQPSQIYFPPENDPNESGKIEKSSDEKAVHQIFDFIIMVTQELAPNFQVIVTDHAKLFYEDFTSNIIEEWRNGIKLIPIDWITN